MKKIFILAVFIAVIGVLCAVFFTRADKNTHTDERPWTVGENASEESRTEETTRAPYKDAVEAFSDYINVTLRSGSAILSTEEGKRYTAQELEKSVLGVYIYDVDGDDAQELCVVRGEPDGVYLDVHEFRDGAVHRADSMRLPLDPMEKTDLSLQLADFTHLSARMTIYPDGADRYFCLTAEQQFADAVTHTMRESSEPASDAPQEIQTTETADETTTEADPERARAGEYNACTVVIRYADEKLSLRKSFRLRQRGFELSLMCTDNVTLLYRYPAAETAKYTDLAMAFQLEFEKLGLSAPQVTAKDGTLTGYKVSPVKSAQTVFALDGTNTDAALTENGFLESFVLPFDN